MEPSRHCVSPGNGRATPTFYLSQHPLAILNRRPFGSPAFHATIHADAGTLQPQQRHFVCAVPKVRRKRGYVSRQPRWPFVRLVRGVKALQRGG